MEHGKGKVNILNAYLQRADEQRASLEGGGGGQSISFRLILFCFILFEGEELTVHLSVCLKHWCTNLNFSLKTLASAITSVETI